MNRRCTFSMASMSFFCTGDQTVVLNSNWYWSYINFKGTQQNTRITTLKTTQYGVCTLTSFSNNCVDVKTRLLVLNSVTCRYSYMRTVSAKYPFAAILLISSSVETSVGSTNVEQRCSTQMRRRGHGCCASSLSFSTV